MCQGLLNFFEQLNLHLPVRYAHTYFDEEFDAKNIVRDDGVRAVALKLTKSLPGLCWLNYFGDTVEEKVLELQRSKRDLADAIINADNSLISNMTREDVELLLS